MFLVHLVFCPCSLCSWFLFLASHVPCAHIVPIAWTLVLVVFCRNVPCAHNFCLTSSVRSWVFHMFLVLIFFASYVPFAHGFLASHVPCAHIFSWHVPCPQMFRLTFSLCSWFFASNVPCAHSVSPHMFLVLTVFSLHIPCAQMFLLLNFPLNDHSFNCSQFEL